MTKEDEWLIVGLITSPHGINGKVKIKSLSDFEERFTKPGERWLQKENEEPSKVELLSGYQKPGKEIFIVNFKEIKTRLEADKVVRNKLLVKNNDIPKLKKNEFHISELLNLKVNLKVDDELKLIGEVCDLENEMTNLLIIKLLKTNKKVRIPFVKEIVTHIDKKNNYLILNPPNGLLDL